MNDYTMSDNAAKMAIARREMNATRQEYNQLRMELGGFNLLVSYEGRHEAAKLARARTMSQLNKVRGKLKTAMREVHDRLRIAQAARTIGMAA